MMLNRPIMNAIVFISLASLFPCQTSASFQAREPVVDRGEIKAGAALTQRFELVNRGSETVTIVDISVGCGCQKHHLSRKEVPPSESAELLMDVNTLPQSAGPNAWIATVKYVEGRQAVKEMQLRIQARVVREITVEPVSLFLSIDKETTHPVTVTDGRAKPLTVTAARCDSPHVKTQLGAKTATGNGAQSQQVLITILATAPAGHSAATLLLITDDAEYRELRVPIVVSRKTPGQVDASPEQIDLRLAHGQTAASGLVRLRDPDDRPVIVDRIESDQSIVRCKWAAGPGAMATLRVGVETGGNAASGSGAVTVYVKEPKPQVLVIPISWKVP
jgi:Protein of unknown function (DUF1573)